MHGAEHGLIGSFFTERFLCMELGFIIAQNIHMFSCRVLGLWWLKAAAKFFRDNVRVCGSFLLFFIERKILPLLARGHPLYCTSDYKRHRFNKLRT